MSLPGRRLDLGSWRAAVGWEEADGGCSEVGEKKTLNLIL
jgi:hypothetical protein